MKRGYERVKIYVVLNVMVSQELKLDKVIIIIMNEEWQGLGRFKALDLGSVKSSQKLVVQRMNEEMT